MLPLVADMLPAPVAHMLNCACLSAVQEVRNRLKAHRKAKRFAQPITMWYVVLHPSVDRKGVEGWMIREAERMGMRLRSNHDARNPSKK